MNECHHVMIGHVATNFCRLSYNNYLKHSTINSLILSWASRPSGTRPK